ncbi:MAG: hypothetical protein HYR85_28245 [Planctomycetes bacterium]|nr:hypothetical protein [Planctomycetota bacterium]MBI3846265.1 hypothetical protein [Planctomycetota bacterium]
MTDVVAVDVGTSSVRAVRYDAGGRVTEEARRPLRILVPRSDRCEHDPAALGAAFDDVLREVCASSPPDGVCIGTYLHGLLPIDSSGLDLGPIQLWCDDRAAAEAANLRRRDAASLLHERTGCPPHGSYPRERLAWMAAHDRRRFDAADRFVSPKAWLIGRLSGRVVEDEATASGSGLFDLEKRCWSREALSAASIDGGRLADVVPTDAIVGTVVDDAARRTGLPAGTPIVAGAGDGMLAAVGSGADMPGTLSITIGTSAALRVVPDAPPRPAIPALWCYVLDRSRFVLGAASNNGAAVLEWARRRWAPEFESVDALEAAIRSRVETPERADLLVLPFVRGERAPFYEPGYGLAISGAVTAIDKLDLIAATWRGVATHLALLFEEIERAAGASSPTAESVKVIASGGGFRSPLLAQTIADAIGRELLVPEDLEASARGAWILGRRALGDGDDPAWRSPIRLRVTPHAARHERFQRDLERHRRALDLMRPIWRRLAQGTV